MDQSKEEMIKEISRLKAAVRKTSSKYLKNDYGKRIKKINRYLASYRYRQEA